MFHALGVKVVFIRGFPIHPKPCLRNLKLGVGGWRLGLGLGLGFRNRIRVRAGVGMGVIRRDRVRVT